MVSLNTNIGALNAARLINLNSQSLAKTQERLASGLRINTASDDPAGAGIADQLTSQIRGDQVGANNIQTGQSMIQVAGAGLTSIADSLQRMRELAVQGNNTGLSASESAALDAEFQALKTAINSVANGATFNGNALLTGATTVTFQSGAAQTQTQALAFTTDYRTTGALAVSGNNVTTAANSQTAQTAVDAAITTVSTGRSTLGAQAQALDNLKRVLDATGVANQDARSKITDADVATEVGNLVRQQLLQSAGASALSSANFAPQFVLSLLK